MKCYKGFDKELKCRGFQYEVGKTYKTKKAELCSSGFHACVNPLDVYSYYAPGTSRFCEVELEGVQNKKDDDSKVCGTKITILRELSIAEFCEIVANYMKENSEKKIHNTGNHSSSSNTGDRSAAMVVGVESSAEVSGISSLAVAYGEGSKAKGSIGCWLTLTEWENGKIIRGVMVEVDGKKILPDTFYILKNNKITKA